MKKLSNAVKASGIKFPKEGRMYVTKDELSKYMDAASRIISADAKLIIAWLQDEGAASDETLKKLVKSGGADENEKNVIAAIKKLAKYNRLKELPIFQTDDEFKSVVNRECTVDELMLDFDTEEGRNKIAKQYEGLVTKIANTYKGKSNLSFEELMSAAWNGFTEALNKYAKGERVSTDDNGNKKWVSFGTFAAQQIRFYILEDIKNFSHTVRIPTSAQAKERRETGRNTKNNTISGDESMSKGNNDKSDGRKTYFDQFASENPGGGMTGDHAAELLQDLISNIRDHFGAKRSRDVEIFIDSFGLNSDEKMKDKEIAAKYGIAASNVTRIKKDVIAYIKSDDECMDLMSELAEYFTESANMYSGNRVVESSNARYNIVTEAQAKFKIPLKNLKDFIKAVL